MNSANFNPDTCRADDATLPESAGRIIRALAHSVAACSQSPPGERAVVATVRGRPVDRQGRRGCHVEFRTAGRPPIDGLQAVRAAGNRLALRDPWTRRMRPQHQDPVVSLHTMGMDHLLLDGWRVTIDLRWPA